MSWSAYLWRVVRPDWSARYGPLPLFLLLLTTVTGFVDAVSYLALGRVFVANMTGNVVFLGFAIAGSDEFSISTSVTALTCFAMGSLACGWYNWHLDSNRGDLLTVAVSTQAGLVAIAALVAAFWSDGSPVVQHLLIVLLALTMGVQNAVVRHLAVPDITTTVLTISTTAMLSDARWLGGPGAHIGRRFSSIIAMFTGGLVGASLVLWVSVAAALVVVLLLLAGVAVASRILSRPRPLWTRPDPTP